MLKKRQVRIKNDYLKLDIQMFADGEISYKVSVEDKNAEKTLDNLSKSGGKVDSTFSKIGSVGAKAFGATAIAVGGLATGLGTLIGVATKSYADLEQNVGGIETLFKNSSKTVIENAKKAYETAGMSANQYMQTVTGFSARLLQGLGGDTEKAARLADMAVQDMSDNANKMGTDINSIVETYQSLARGNYEMLDNLKLGYGGTQTEMARLINESGVLGDTMTVTAETVNSVSFDKVIEAIHTVQDRMGITGTTAKEASTTITGSMNAMKASFDNFLNGTGTPEQLSETIVTFLKNVGGAIGKLAPAIIDGIVQLTDSLIQYLPEAIQKIAPALTEGAVQLINSLVTALPLLTQALFNTILQLLQTLTPQIPLIVQNLLNGALEIVNQLSQLFPTLIPQLVQAILSIIPVLLQNAPLFLQAGVQLILGLADGLINAIPILISYLPQIIQSLITYILSYLPQMLSLGIQLIAKLAFGLIKAIPQIVGSIPQILSAIFNGLKDGIGNMAKIGLDLIKGLWNGIKDAKKWILDKIKGFGKSVLNGLKDFFGINSPSKEFAWIGKMNVLGLEEGMEDNIPGLNKTIDRTIAYEATGLDYLTNGFDNYSGAISNGVLANANYNQPIFVTVNADMDVNKFGKAFVRDIKTFSGGTKNSYNYGGGK